MPYPRNRKLVLCNGASKPKGYKQPHLILEYRQGCATEQNVITGIPRFVQSVNHIDPKFLDLIELACYVYAADRFTSRGESTAVEYHRWSRDFRFIQKVREFDFWQSDKIRKSLSKALVYLMGDKAVDFEFRPGHSTDAVDLFDEKMFTRQADRPTHVMLFSGGIDSFAGLLYLLQTTPNDVAVVSHKSGNVALANAQKDLLGSLSEEYSRRVQHFVLRSGIKGARREESQRSRVFLFTAIAYTLCQVYGNDELYLFDNGITSINLNSSPDLINARASRTTHPKTLALLSEFYTSVTGKRFTVVNPFQKFTKGEVVRYIKKSCYSNSLQDAISCGSAFNKGTSANHCGHCLQCIDRRISMYAEGLGEIDSLTNYGLDVITQGMSDKARISVIDYIGHAFEILTTNPDSLQANYVHEFNELIDYYEGEDDEDRIKNIHALYIRHATNVNRGLKAIQALYDDLAKPKIKNSLTHILSQRDYLAYPATAIAIRIEECLRLATPLMFAHVKPVNENDLNDKIQAILFDKMPDYFREYPLIEFASTKSRPDHSFSGKIYIEVKYIRGSRQKSKITDEIAADVVKYRDAKHIVFIIYDPEKRIIDVDLLKRDFERDGKCTLLVFH